MQRIFHFGADEKSDLVGDAAKNLLGGKGAGLAEMSRLGLPVPPGFTITTEVCTEFNGAGQVLPKELESEMRDAMKRVENAVGATFGDSENPLLLSVRSGARVSMPGMMDTVLNLGLNDTTVAALSRRTNNPRFAFDSYRRFVAMYGSVVMEVKAKGERDPDPFEAILAEKKRAVGANGDTDLSADDLKDIVTRFKALIQQDKGTPFPDDPWQQLAGAVAAVFRSWENPRADVYRKMYGYSAAWGTAVNVQAMVFGNMGDDCATGVAFTRDPATGLRDLFGEFLRNAQGEDVVAGTRTPRPIVELGEQFPESYQQLLKIRDGLEAHFRDMQDIEFTIQQHKLWMLQTRRGKRSGRAMIKIAVDSVNEGLIDKTTALLGLEAEKLDELLHPMIDPKAERNVLTKGLPASPGAAIGKVVFTAGDAEAWAQKGEAVILVRTETSPEDIHGMKAAEGILTARGGMTSHAAVVARGMGKPCVASAKAVHIDVRKGQAQVGDHVIHTGDVITLDGSTGEVIVGPMPLSPAKLDDDYHTVMGWVDAARRLRVRTNADTPMDAQTARAFGAEGIGLCRTEHMFFDAERIIAVRQMIMADTESARREALAKILPMQREDFDGIFRAMDGLPVTVRLLDPPLHEFLPVTEKAVAEVAAALGVDASVVAQKRETLFEQNPMLGHRGCRLGITHPEIYETQVTALAQAACSVHADGVVVLPEIMIPLVSVGSELSRLRQLVITTFDAVLAANGVHIPYTVGTMIELPRACLIADQIAEHADFFSFGTNDLTQTTFGFSRDDIGGFLPDYIAAGLLPNDPFAVLDQNGVGQLVEMGVQKGRSTRPGLKIGICGEHGGDPASVQFCHRVGLDYVSCSPFRLPIARVAAAQAALAQATKTAP